MKRRQTPSQTVGPFFAYGLTPQQYGYPLSSVATPDIAAGQPEASDGERIRIEGRVFDGQGQPIDDAMIEIWHADAKGRFAHPSDPRRANDTLRGFGRTGTGTDPTHRFWFDTIKPGAAEPGHAPFVSVIVFMRGLPTHAYTRLYFDDESDANASDPVLSAVPIARRETLVARRADSRDDLGAHLGGTPVYRFDIHMQGDRETVFFDV